MEEFGGTGFDGLSHAIRKKRSQTSRRPRPDSLPFSEVRDHSPLTSAPTSDDLSKGSSDENAGCNVSSKRKEFNLNQCISRALTATEDDENFHKKARRDGGLNLHYNNEPGKSGLYNRRSSEGVLAPANWKGVGKLKDGLESELESIDICGGRTSEDLSSGQTGALQDGSGNENRVKKVKLKVGGVTRTFQANTASNSTSASGSSSADAPRSRQKQSFQGIPWKGSSSDGYGLDKEDSVMGKMPGKNASGKPGDRWEAVRKSKRVPKTRVLDAEFGDDDEEDDEIRYLEKLKTSKVSAVYKQDDEESSRKHRRLSSVSNMENVGLSRTGKDGKKSRSDKTFEDTDYEEEKSASDSELEGKKKKKQKREPIDSVIDSKRDLTLTTRQRALQNKDASASQSSLIEFPNGLPPAPPKKQKEKLSEVEQQLKKAEAAQRRRMQVEKAARESEAEAIRKILGQDSSRKRKEEKLKKWQEELAQEKAANALMLASNTIRWVTGPSGTVVTFSQDMGLPSIFDSKPCSYPAPRENCAGPSCTNLYKYRDSKSRLPLCSLQCYKAIQEKMVSETTC